MHWPAGPAINVVSRESSIDNHRLVLMLRIPYVDLLESLKAVFLNKAFPAESARLCARLFAETTRDGVYSHGLNRLPRFIRMVELGVVKPDVEPVRMFASGALEQWDGHQGPGNVNAWISMERAVQLARDYGIGCVALANTNHWMRGGTYGWQAAGHGFIGICWTNTSPNLPSWGSRECRVGNNPLVMAVPRVDGPVVLDIAMSQYSYGGLESYRMKGLRLPVPGGYDTDGNLTDDPAAVEESGRPLPIGFWKGSGLALMLDLIAALLTGGKPTCDISSDPLRETRLSQVYIALDPHSALSRDAAEELTDRIVGFFSGGEPAAEWGEVRYPGERVLRNRMENLQQGVPVEPEVWKQIKEWAAER